MGNNIQTPNGKGEKTTAVSNVVKLDPGTPVPIEYNGFGYVSRRGKRYVPFHDPGDNFFQILLELKLQSLTTFSCVHTKTLYCIGEGWSLADGKEDVKLTEWAKCVNAKNQTLNDVSKSVFDHFHTVGNCFIEIVRGKNANGKFIKVYTRNFLDCRVAMPDDDCLDDTPTAIIISKEFRKNGFIKLKNYAEIPIYNGLSTQQWLEDEQGNEHIMIHVRNEVGGFDYYGLPDNIATVEQQSLERQNARYNSDNFENNLVIGGAIFLEGNMTDEEANKAAKKVVETHRGSGKRGRWTVFAGEGIGQSKVEQYENPKDGSFIEFDKHNSDKIIAGNLWDSILFSGNGDKGLGNGGSAYIRSVFEIKNNIVIKPTQQLVIEKFIQPLFEICDKWMGTKWSSLGLQFKTNAPISFVGDLNINALLTVDEGREALGERPLEDSVIGKAIIAPGAPKQLNLFNQPPAK